MTPQELLNLAEQRLLQLDEQHQATTASFDHRIDVVDQLRELAIARAQYELLRTQTFRIRMEIARSGSMQQFTSFQLPGSS